MATKPTTRRAGRNTNIATSHPSVAKTKGSELKAITRITQDYVDVSLGSKAGYTSFRLETGDATYRAVTFAIKSSVSLDGDKSVETNGLHYVKAEFLSEFLSNVRWVPDGSPMQELSIHELMVRNSFHGINYGEFYTGFAFPGEFTYSSTRMTDAFAFGTKGLRSLSIDIKPTDAFDHENMEIVVMPHTVDRVKSTGFTYATERLNTTFSGVGKHTYTDLPIGDDIKDLWIQAEGIQSIILKIDGDKLFEMDRVQYEAYLTEKGKDVSVLNGGWMLDVHAERVPRSIAALDSKAERKRDARVELTVITTQATTPVEFLMTTSDIYNKIR